MILARAARQLQGWASELSQRLACREQIFLARCASSELPWVVVRVWNSDARAWTSVEGACFVRVVRSRHWAQD